MRKNTPKKSHWRQWLVGFLVVGALALLFIPSPNQRPKQPSPPLFQPAPVYNFNPEEAKTLTNELLAATVPSLPENNYFTPLMKEKLQWFANEHAAGRLLLTAAGKFATDKAGRENRAVLMAANYTSANSDGKPPYKPFLEIYTPRLLMLVRIQQKVQTGFNQICKNTFALAIVHEIVHLEREETYYTTPHSDEEILKEEDRAWVKVGLGAVHPLRLAGQPLETDYIESDDIMQRCGYKTGCPEFLEYLKRDNKAAVSYK